MGVRATARLYDRDFTVRVDLPLVVNNPSFPGAEVKPMKERILAQIEGEDADWEQQALRFFKKQYYGPINSPYQFLPRGTKE